MKHFAIALSALVLALTSCVTSGGLLGPSIDELPQRFVTIELFFET